MPAQSSWMEQWCRIARWYERVRQSQTEVRGDGLGTEGYRDEVYALFQAIWHLKDWFINDDEVPVTKPEVHAWIDERADVLKVAHDVANGSKHMTLSRPWAGGSEQGRNDATIVVGQGVQHVFYIQDARNGQDWNALSLADQCLAEWRSFLEQHGLAEPDCG